MAAGDNTYFEGDGKAVQVDLTSTVDTGQVAYVDGWLGIAAESGDSGDSINLEIDEREYQLTLPAGFAGAKGDEIWIDVTDLTGHIPDSTAYYKATGANRRRLFRLTSAQNGTTNVATARMVQQ